MRDVLLAGACRTAIGKFGGSLAEVPAPTLGAHVVAAALRRAGVPAEAVDEALLGNVLQAGHGFNLARQAVLAAGLPIGVPAMTVNMVCGSGLRAVIDAARLVASGEAEVVVAGGAEAMSRAPYLLPKERWGARLGHTQVTDSMLRDGLEDPSGYAMGVTAENLARRYGLTRDEQDTFAVESQRRAVEAAAAGAFAPEIEPYELAAKGGTVQFDRDEHPRPDTSLEKVARLRPAFDPEGTVTAANSSGICDGAAAVVVLSPEAAARHGVTPAARVTGWAYAGCEPECMGLGPALAIPKLLARSGGALDDFAAVEINEAFAAQTLAVLCELELDPARVNRRGGAIALGHPLGASGARILVTLLGQLAAGQQGLASLCCGGGMGVALAVEAV